MSDAPKRAPIGRVIAVVVVLALVALAVGLLPLRSAIATLVDTARGAGVAGALGYGAAYAIATVALIPGSLLTLGAGLAWGTLVGFLIVWPAATVGALASFGLARTVLRGRVAAIAARDPRFEAVDRAIGEHGGRIVLLLRLSPVFPFSVLNWGLGVTRVGFVPYALATAVGIVPGTLLYVAAGSTLTSVAELGAGRADTGWAGRALTWAGLLLALGVTLYVTRIARRALATIAPEAR